ncbi:MAG: acyl-CoA dehydratase activase-related protein [Firmicutes bacterium]|nr:acyl-CoA dehydratase activase-related protein [Bacillota bacterium]
MKIGLPRALLYYRYQHLWTDFFCRLGHEVVVSPETNPQILAQGIWYSVDESCLPGKIFLGHVQYLIGKCDYILIPRIDNFGINEKVCVKLNALCDVVRNTFPFAPVLDYNIDAEKGKSEVRAFIQLGKTLAHSAHQSVCAYRGAADFARHVQQKEYAAQLKKLASSAPKILLIGHSYVLSDRCAGAAVARGLERLGACVLKADKLSSTLTAQTAAFNAPNLYWTFNKELFGAAAAYKPHLDGMVYVTAFPCGVDALAHEFALRRLKGVPSCHIVVDEAQGDTGLSTRLESFMDILHARRLAK